MAWLGAWIDGAATSSDTPVVSNQFIQFKMLLSAQGKRSYYSHKEE